jgi:type IV secretion system protein VirD4
MSISKEELTELLIFITMLSVVLSIVGIPIFELHKSILLVPVAVLGVALYVNTKYSDGKKFHNSNDKENNNLIGELHTYDGERHLITFAPNGSGKFTTVQAPVLLSLNRSMLVIDPKGQAAAVTARRRREMGHKVITLNPFGLHGLPQHRYNPLAALDPVSPCVADVMRLVDGLIDVTGHDSFFSDSARDLFGWLIMWTVLKEEEKTLATVRDLLCLPDSAFVKLATQAAQVDFAPLRNKAAGFMELDKTLKSVIQTAKAETRIFDEPIMRESLSGSDFDFAELKEGKTTVYIILPADYLGSHAKWLRVLVMSALSAMYRRHDGERVLGVSSRNGKYRTLRRGQPS